ncbi:hypothetical protein Q7P37_001066 [Cladosporium fusiforme]
MGFDVKQGLQLFGQIVDTGTQAAGGVAKAVGGFVGGVVSGATGGSDEKEDDDKDSASSSTSTSSVSSASSTSTSTPAATTVTQSSASGPLTVTVAPPTPVTVYASQTASSTLPDESNVRDEPGNDGGATMVEPNVDKDDQESGSSEAESESSHGANDDEPTGHERPHAEQAESPDSDEQDSSSFYDDHSSGASYDDEQSTTEDTSADPGQKYSSSSSNEESDSTYGSSLDQSETSEFRCIRRRGSWEPRDGAFVPLKPRMASSMLLAIGSFANSVTQPSQSIASRTSATPMISARNFYPPTANSTTAVSDALGAMAAPVTYTTCVPGQACYGASGTLTTSRSVATSSGVAVDEALAATSSSGPVAGCRSGEDCYGMTGALTASSTMPLATNMAGSGNGLANGMESDPIYPNTTGGPAPYGVPMSPTTTTLGRLVRIQPDVNALYLGTSPGPGYNAEASGGLLGAAVPGPTGTAVSGLYPAGNGSVQTTASPGVKPTAGWTVPVSTGVSPQNGYTHTKRAVQNSGHEASSSAPHGPRATTSRGTARPSVTEIRTLQTITITSSIIRREISDHISNPASAGAHTMLDPNATSTLFATRLATSIGMPSSATSPTVPATIARRAAEPRETMPSSPYNLKRIIPRAAARAGAGAASGESASGDDTISSPQNNPGGNPQKPAAGLEGSAPGNDPINKPQKIPGRNPKEPGATMGSKISDFPDVILDPNDEEMWAKCTVGIPRWDRSKANSQKNLSGKPGIKDKRPRPDDDSVGGSTAKGSQGAAGRDPNKKPKIDGQTSDKQPGEVGQTSANQNPNANGKPSQVNALIRRERSPNSADTSTIRKRQSNPQASGSGSGRSGGRSGRSGSGGGSGGTSNARDRLNRAFSRFRPNRHRRPAEQLTQNPPVQPGGAGTGHSTPLPAYGTQENYQQWNPEVTPPGSHRDPDLRYPASGNRYPPSQNSRVPSGESPPYGSRVPSVNPPSYRTNERGSSANVANTEQSQSGDEVDPLRDSSANFANSEQSQSSESATQSADEAERMGFHRDSRRPDSMEGEAFDRLPRRYGQTLPVPGSAPGARSGAQGSGAPTQGGYGVASESNNPGYVGASGSGRTAQGGYGAPGSNNRGNEQGSRGSNPPAGSGGRTTGSRRLRRSLGRRAYPDDRDQPPASSSTVPSSGRSDCEEPIPKTDAGSSYKLVRRGCGQSRPKKDTGNMGHQRAQQPDDTDYELQPPAGAGSAYARPEDDDNYPAPGFDAPQPGAYRPTPDSQAQGSIARPSNPNPPSQQGKKPQTRPATPKYPPKDVDPKRYGLDSWTDIPQEMGQGFMRAEHRDYSIEETYPLKRPASIASTPSGTDPLTGDRWSAKQPLSSTLEKMEQDVPSDASLHRCFPEDSSGSGQGAPPPVRRSRLFRRVDLPDEPLPPYSQSSAGRNKLPRSSLQTEAGGEGRRRGEEVSWGEWSGH